MSVFMQNYLDVQNQERSQGSLQQVNTLNVNNIREKYGNETAGMTDQQVETWYQSSASQSNIDRNTLTPDDVNADLTYERREDWERTYKQFEDMSIANVMDPERRAELRGQAFGITGDAVNNAMDRKDKRMQTYLSRMGQRRGGAEQSGTQRENAIQKTSMMTKARNDTRGYLNRRESNLLGTGGV